MKNFERFRVEVPCFKGNVPLGCIVINMPATRQDIEHFERWIGIQIEILKLQTIEPTPPPAAEDVCPRCRNTRRIKYANDAEPITRPCPVCTGKASEEVDHD